MSAARAKLLNGIKNLDLFSQPIFLYANKKEHHQTIFGSLLTIGLIILFANLFYIKIVSLFNRNNPTSLSTEVYHPQPNFYKLTPNNFTLTFAFQNSSFNTYIDESIYVVNANLGSKRTEIINGVKQEIWDKKRLPLVPCSSQLIKETQLQDYFSHVDLHTNYCIDWNSIDSIPLEGTFDALQYQYILITFNQCTKKNQKNQKCKSPEEIARALDQNYFSVQLTSYTTDLKNPSSPYNPKGQDIFTTISSKIFKEISVYLEPLTSITDFGYLQTNIEQDQTLRYGRHTEMLDLSESDLIMNIVIRLDTTEYVDYRTYPKIQEILAELGGLWQVLFSLFYIISKPFNKTSYFLTLINQLYCSDDENINSQQVDRKCCQKDRKDSPSPLIRQATSSEKAREQQQPDRIISKSDAQVSQKQNQPMTLVNACAQYLEMKMKMKKKKKLEFTFFDILQALQCVATADNNKVKQFQQAKQQIINQINIVDILKKLQDIDKLKHIIFNDKQQILFENIKIPSRESPAPDISIQQELVLKKQFITKSDLIQVISDQNSQINQRLVASLNQTVGVLLKQQHQDMIEEQI